MNEKLLWKDFAAQESCDGCPLLEEEICPRGMTCYGGEPVEPPCTCFDDDTDLNQWVIDYYKRLNYYEELEDARIKEERKRKERAKKAADTRRKMQWYCWNEIHELKQAKQELKAQLNLENFVKTVAEAVNFANATFHCEERLTVKPQVSEKVKLLQERVDEAKAAFDAKRKQFYEEQKKG